MIEIAREITIKLSELNNISYEHLSNHSRFKLISKVGVRWSEKASKLGNISYRDDHLLLALDYPIGELSEIDIAEKLNLPIRKPRDNFSGFYLIQGDKFDSVRIYLYQDELSKLNLNDSILINFAQEILNKSKH